MSAVSARNQFNSTVKPVGAHPLLSIGQFEYGEPGDRNYCKKAIGHVIGWEQDSRGNVCHLVSYCDKVVGVYAYGPGIVKSVVARSYPSQLTGATDQHDAACQCARWIRAATL